MMFYGIPTTFMGAVFASGYLAWLKFSMVDEVMAVIPFALFLAAVAMVSSVKLPKIKPRKSMALNVFQGLNILTAYIIAPMQMYPEVLFLQGMMYLTVGVAWYSIAPPQFEEEAILGTESASGM
jgi:CDP-diacylglycerol--serine O-phosphatidyltransferase